jgi:GT2 family glycosyltransferase
MNKCLVVLVLYKQKLIESTSFQSLMQAWPAAADLKLVVYDNSPEGQPMAGLPETISLEYIHDPSNPGVGKAYNCAGRIAREEGYRWMMLLDQDSQLPANLFRRYDEAIKAFPQAMVFAPKMFDQRGLLSPFRNGRTSGRRLSDITPGLHPLGDVAIINSGMLIPVSAFHQAGGYDERLRLDFSDIHFLGQLSRLTSDLVVVDASGQQNHSDNTTLFGEALLRFNHYITAARIMGQVERATFAYRLQTMGRALKLSLRYRSLRFLHTALTASI